IGVAAPEPVKNVVIDECTAFECGYQFTTEEVQSEEGIYRGGMAIFSTFGSDPSVNIQVSNCTAFTSTGEYGTFFANAQNITVENCNMALTNVDTGADWPETSAVITSFFSQDIVVKNCVAYG